MASLDADNAADNGSDGARPPYIHCKNNPVAILHSKYIKLSLKEEDNFDFERHRISVGFFLEYLFTQRSCVIMEKPQRSCPCNCLGSILLSAEEKRCIWDYVLNFAKQTKLEQNKIVFEWLRYALASARSGTHVREGSVAYKEAKARRFLLPGLLHMICENACMRLIGWGPKAWAAMTRAAKANKIPVHGNTGKASNNSLRPSTVEKLDSFFEDLKEHAAPRATRVVRIVAAGGDTAKLELRDADPDLLELPPYYNTLNLYRMWCLSVGYSPKFDAKNRLIEMAAIGGPKDAVRVPRKEVVSLPTFRKFWKTTHPKVVTQRAREDVCEECFAFANRHKYKQKRQEIKDSIQDAAGDFPFTEDDLEAALGDTGFSKMEDERMLRKVSSHVRMQKIQRDYVISKRNEAISDRDKPQWQRCYTFVADYAQNCYVPNFADEQPGKTYFLSPLNAYVFGVCDASATPTKLSAHFYMEPDGQKGGNNVASLLWKELRMRQLLPALHPTTRAPMGRTHKPTNEVNFVFDNCTGQNKNRFVLRMLYFMVARKVCKVARCIFLVRGHTKNECDRMFNAMKSVYRKTNVYTPSDLYKALNTHAQVAAVPAQEGDFRDWGELQDIYMNPLKNIKRYHIFEVSDLQPETLWCQEAAGSPRVAQPLVKESARGAKGRYSWRHDMPEPLEVPGIRYLTWKEIYDKWKTVIPQEKWEQWKYLHQDMPKAKRDGIKANTSQAKKTRKGRERENNTDDTAKKQKMEVGKTAAV